MAQIIWSPLAEDDLKIISDYISIDSEFYAEKAIDKIYERTAVLETQIYIGKVGS